MLKNVKFAAFVLGACGLVTLPAGAQSKKSTADRVDQTAMKSADHAFVMKAAEGGMAEVDMGQLAVEKASNPEVKAFGQRMVDDHSKANDELKSLASSKGINLPTSVSAKDKAMHDHFNSLSGAAFDRAYMQHMVTDHRKDVAEFRKESTSGKDSEVKAWAGKTLPTLEEHLKMAESTNAKVKSGK